jgi:hypothetical protein
MLHAACHMLYICYAYIIASHSMLLCDLLIVALGTVHRSLSQSMSPRLRAVIVMAADCIS